MFKKTILVLSALLPFMGVSKVSAQESSFIFQPGPSGVYVRKNASSPGAAADLKALNDALAKMRQMGCEDPSSWYYQGATHSVPDKVDNGNPLCPSFTNINTTPLKWGWATCTHKDGSELHFLIWHRLYIAHFEAIVRKLSGKSDFALPYWDYTNRDYRVMPGPFRVENSSLFEHARLPSLNQGKAIDNSMDKALDTTNLFENKVFADFNSDIDAAPHGAMHVYIGGGYDGLTMWNPIYQNDLHAGLMTQVPSAAFDPIFWLHHSNIDYLWQRWENSPNGSRPSLEELEVKPWPYQFYTPDNQRVSYTVKQAYVAAFNPNYVYDQAPIGVSALGSPVHKQLTDRHGALRKTLAWSETVNQPLVNGKLSLSLSSQSFKKQRQLKSQPVPRAVTVEITTSFTHEPKAVYIAYVVDSKGVKKTAGVLTFFGAVHHAGSHSGHGLKITKDFSFDVSDELQSGETFSLYVEKIKGEDKGLTIDSIRLFTH